jgi:hypothetical protein
MPQYMVIKRFREGHSGGVFDRLHTKGQLLPEGLHFVASWLCASDARCFQIMETEDPTLFEAWKARWDDLIELEIVELKPKPLPERESME